MDPLSSPPAKAFQPSSSALASASVFMQEKSSVGHPAIRFQRLSRPCIRRIIHQSIAILAMLGICEGVSSVYGGESKTTTAVFDIVKEGQPQTSIVIPVKALPAVTYAAQELQYHIQKATGVIVPIIEEGAVQSHGNSSGVIYLGACRQTVENGVNAMELPANGFIIKLIGRDLFIVGDDTPGEVLGYTPTRVGTLFGVYEFLEKQMGVKWLWPGELGEVVPSSSSIAVQPWDQMGAPKLLHNRWREATEIPGEGWSSPQAKARYRKDERVWLKRQRFTVAVPMDIHHAFTSYWDRFGKSHPEYFNQLPDGERRPETAPIYVAMCVSQPALWKQIITDWKKQVWPQNQPWLDASENDVVGKCTCPICMSWDAKDPELKIPLAGRLDAVTAAFKKGDPQWPTQLGRLSDRYARFYLEVQKEAEKTDPKAVVMGLAYANYWQPPIETKLNDRIVIALVPAFGYPWTEESQKRFEQQWEGWAASGASLLLRPNYTLAGHSFPIFFAEKLAKHLAFTMKHGLIGTDFDSLNGQWGTQGPNLYVLPRIINHPEQPVDEVLDEYYSAFGPAKEQVKAYFEHWKAVSDAVTGEFYKEVGGDWGFYQMAHKIFTPKIMEKGFTILAEAERASHGDKTASLRVLFLKKGLMGAQLTLKAQAAYEEYKTSGDLGAFRQAVGELDEFREKCEPDNIANMGFYRYPEGWRWPRAALNLQLGRSLGAQWKFSWDTEKQGEKLGWWKDGFDDTAWQNNSVTSSWMETELGLQWKAKHDSDYEGVAWYRTAFSLSRPVARRRYFLSFGAVHGPCKVWLNGKLVLERSCPNTNAIREAFRIDVSSDVRFDQPNVVAVQTEAIFGAGGIYRSVGIYEAEAGDPNRENFISNPGFEDSKGEGATGWKAGEISGDCKLSIDHEEKLSGAASGRITCLQLDANMNKSSAGWQQPFRVKKGTTYQLRLYVKTSPEFNGSAEIVIRSGGEGNERTASLASTGGLWQQLMIKDIVPQDDEATLDLKLTDGTGSLWFDDIEFTEQEPQSGES